MTRREKELYEMTEAKYLGPHPWILPGAWFVSNLRQAQNKGKLTCAVGASVVMNVRNLFLNDSFFFKKRYSPQSYFYFSPKRNLWHFEMPVGHCGFMTG